VFSNYIRDANGEAPGTRRVCLARGESPSLTHKPKRFTYESERI